MRTTQQRMRRHGVWAGGMMAGCRQILTLLWMTAPLLMPVSAAASETWPTVVLPKSATRFDVSTGTVKVNGLPMRLQGFVSKEPPAQLASWFRQNLGQPLAENRLVNQLVIGKASGTHYVTVQLEPAGQGTRGLVAVTDMKRAQENETQTLAERERWLGRLPGGSHLLSVTKSEDAGKLALQAIITNGHSEALNRDRINLMMQEDGLVLEREVPAELTGTGGAQRASGSKKTLFFKGRDKESIAVIFRHQSGRTVIVLNTVTSMEQFK